MTTALQALPDHVIKRLCEIHSELSPESLTADGELSEAEWGPRKVQLDAELLQIQANHRLSQDDVDEFAAIRELDGRRDAARRGRGPRPR